MTIEYSLSNTRSAPNVTFQSREPRTVANYERELIEIGTSKSGYEKLSPGKRPCFVKRTN